MRKYLIILGILVILGLIATWWLGQQAVKNKPADGEVRMEVEGVL
ncbi:hypothetical protein [Hyphomonas sp.]|jgi:hypothetical protein|tara:strand:+ start:1021 stop:1155 length:135 start_codon:yes stop_codon:yes gene_type:complete